MIINPVIYGAPSKTIEYSQTNPVVAAYITDVEYDPTDYTTSEIDKYVNQSTSYAKSKPSSVTVSLRAGKLIVVDEYSGIATETEVSTGDHTIYNLVPYGGSYYNVVGDKIVKSGYLKPTGQVRMINCPQAANVRDLGGWACDGGTIKYGKLFRGGEVTASDRSVLVDQLGIKHDLNLRGSTEATWNTSPLGEDIYFTKADEYNWYSVTATEAWRINLRCIFDAVTHGEPVYFHCAAGADRTGTLACIIEGILGVNQNDIDKDYEMTAFCTYRTRNGDYGWENLINAVTALEGDTFRDKCINFVASCGFTADEINAFRSAMIDGTPETVTPAIDTFTVTTDIADSVSVNGDSTATEYQSYTADITVADGYAIDSIKVIMDSKDVTASVFSGVKTNIYRHVTNELDNCKTNELKAVVMQGQAYTARLSADDNFVIDNIKVLMGGVDITADAFIGVDAEFRYKVNLSLSNCKASTYAVGAVADKPYTVTLAATKGYTLDGATVTVAMGGVDVSNFYSGGVISIPKVTGDIVITATAAESASTMVDVPLEWHENYGCEYTVGKNFGLTVANGYLTTDAIPVVTGAEYIITVPAALYDFRVIGADDDGLIVDVVRFKDTATAKTQLTYQPIDGVTQIRIRTYMEITSNPQETYILQYDGKSGGSN